MSPANENFYLGIMCDSHFTFSKGLDVKSRNFHISVVFHTLVRVKYSFHGLGLGLEFELELELGVL